MTKFSPVLKMMTKSDSTFLYNLRGMIKFYKTSNPQIRIITCKKRYKRRKYDSATMRQENQVVLCRKSNAKNLF